MSGDIHLEHTYLGRGFSTPLGEHTIRIKEIVFDGEKDGPFGPFAKGFDGTGCSLGDLRRVYTNEISDAP